MKGVKVVKKLLLIIFVFFGCCLSCFAFDSVNDGQEVFYMPQTQSWSFGLLTDERIVLTKKTSSGTGSFSQYYFSDGNLAVFLSSNYEFIFDGKLIAINNAELRYNEIVYEDGKFIEKPLSIDYLKTIFPNAEIIRISQFKNGKLSLNKPFFKKKTVLLLNDTENNYYKFSYKPQNIKNPYITGLITIKHPGIITFSHYGDKEGKLKIFVY